MIKRKAAGFSLLEVLVSLSLFSVVSAIMATSFTTHQDFNTQSALRTAAAMAAQQVLDTTRVEDPASLPTYGSSAAENVTIGTKTFQVVTTYCPISTYCSSANIRHLRLEVSYNGDLQYEVDTVYTRLQ